MLLFLRSPWLSFFCARSVGERLIRQAMPSLKFKSLPVSWVVKYEEDLSRILSSYRDGSLNSFEFKLWNFQTLPLRFNSAPEKRGKICKLWGTHPWISHRFSLSISGVLSTSWFQFFDLKKWVNEKCYDLNSYFKLFFDSTMTLHCRVESTECHNYGQLTIRGW